MRIRPSIILSAATLLFAPSAHAQYVDFVQDSFEYTPGPLGGQAGGQGWYGTWWSGQSTDGAIIEVPGLDGIGGMLTTNLEHEGSYRLIDMTPLAPIAENQLLGKDGTSVWIRYTFRRSVGSDDLYGGIVLNQQFVGEQLFIGSPWGTDELGIERPFVTAPTTIAGTDCDNENTIIARIDFLPGDDRVQVWANPGVPFPTTPAAIDQLMPDIVFNEIKFSSGSGGTHGFHFDDFVMSAPEFGPQYAIAGLVASSKAKLTVTNAIPGSVIVLGYSLTGAGPSLTPYGDVAMSQPIQQLPQMVVDPTGVAQMDAWVPAGAQGLTVYSQGVEILASGGSVLTNALVEVVL